MSRFFSTLFEFEFLFILLIYLIITNNINNKSLGFVLLVREPQQLVYSPLTHAPQRIFIGTLLGRPCLIKERFVKQYRHADLDAKLTARRIHQVPIPGTDVVTPLL